MSVIDAGTERGDRAEARTHDRVEALAKAWRLHFENPSAAISSRRLTPRPYPGLKSFAPEEAGVFFGRSDEVRKVASRLDRNNVLVVLGGSGSGKSSLVRAGLLPHLGSLGKLPERPGRWYVAEMRPGTNPTGMLVEAVWSHVCRPQLQQPFGVQA